MLPKSFFKRICFEWQVNNRKDSLAFKYIIRAKDYVEKPPSGDLPVVPTIFAEGIIEGDSEVVPLFIGVILKKSFYQKKKKN